MFRRHLQRCMSWGCVYTHMKADEDNEYYKVSIFVPNGAIVEIFLNFQDNLYKKDGSTFFYVARFPLKTEKPFVVKGIPFVTEIVRSALMISGDIPSLR